MEDFNDEVKAKENELKLLIKKSSAAEFSTRVDFSDPLKSQLLPAAMEPESGRGGGAGGKKEKIDFISTFSIESSFVCFPH